MRESAKPSDFNLFCVTVHSASATLLDLETYCEYYNELLGLLFWNPHVDTQIAIEQEQQLKQKQ